ncbi:phosphotransferase [Actinomycetospora atypica]|uniref:Phosphotransferase n=1 Tax=Actinomycetospora atypica TaxID=1290095 RepID=A0ABV9YN20_9PSEU
MTTREYLGSGWDCDAVLVDGVWVERTARRPDVEPWLRTETTLLPWLAPQLPLPVPAPVVVGTDPLVTRHRYLPGRPVPDAAPGLGATIGAFLRALHAVDLDEAVARGLPGPDRTLAMRDASWARFDDEVLPLLGSPERTWLAGRLDVLRDAPATVVVHGDLSADHVLADGDGITGVIDWGDARAGDPAKDLLWPLHGAGAAVARAAQEAYGSTPELRRRAAAWRDVAPCYAVTHGLDTGDDDLVRGTLHALRLPGT